MAVTRIQSTINKNTRVLLAFLTLLCWSSLVAPCFAQEAEQRPAAPKIAKPKPVAISVPRIPNEILALENRLNNIQKKISDQRIEEDVQQSLTTTENVIGSMEVKLENLLYGLYAPTDLTASSKRWKEISDFLRAMDSKLSKRAERLEGWLGEVREQISVWQLTRSAAESAHTPQLVLDEVARTLEKLYSSQKDLEASRNNVVDLKSQIAALQVRVQAALEKLEEARSNLTAMVFSRQAVPLWSIDLASQNLAQQFGRIAQTLNEFPSEIRDYLNRCYQRLIFQSLIMLALALAIQRMRSSRERKKVDALAEDTPKDASHPDMISYPWSSALLIGLGLTRVLQPTAPTAIFFTVGLFWVVAWLRVLSLLLPKGRRKPLYGFAALAFMIFARDLLDAIELLFRILLIMELALGVVGALWLRKSKWLDRIPLLRKGSLWYLFFKGWQDLALWSFSAGLLAVVLGYVILGDRIATVFIQGSFYGASFLAGARILEDITAQALERLPVSRLDMSQEQGERFIGTIRHGFRTLAFLTWAYLLLERMALGSTLVDNISTILSARLGYGSITFSLGGMLAFAATVWISWMLARAISFAFYRGVFSRLDMQPGVPYALASFIRHSIFVIGFLAAIANLGLSLDRITLMVSALGVGIGFGLQNIAKDIVSGAVLLFERPLRVGDWVEVENLLGVVTRIGIRASTVRTRDGAEVVVPNGDLISGRVTNWTLSDARHRVKVEIGVAYGTDPEKVLNILMKAAQTHPDVLATPAPRALFRGFGESSLNFELRVWTQSTLRGWQAALKSDLSVVINKVLAQNGIEIPFPQRDLHLRSVMPELREAMIERTDTDNQVEPHREQREVDLEVAEPREVKKGTRKIS